MSGQINYGSLEVFFSENIYSTSLNIFYTKHMKCLAPTHWKSNTWQMGSEISLVGFICTLSFSGEVVITPTATHMNIQFQV